MLSSSSENLKHDDFLELNKSLNFVPQSPCCINVHRKREGQDIWNLNYVHGNNNKRIRSVKLLTRHLNSF